MGFDHDVHRVETALAFIDHIDRDCPLEVGTSAAARYEALKELTAHAPEWWNLLARVVDRPAPDPQTIAVVLSVHRERADAEREAAKAAYIADGIARLTL